MTEVPARAVPAPTGALEKPHPLHELDRTESQTAQHENPEQENHDGIVQNQQQTEERFVLHAAPVLRFSFATGTFRGTNRFGQW
jgi:hypothetical protein